MVAALTKDGANAGNVTGHLNAAAALAKVNF
jgi:hypothetical protein